MTQEKFEEFMRIRATGEVNMAAAVDVSWVSGNFLSTRDVKDIIANFNDYRIKWGA